LNTDLRANYGYPSASLEVRGAETFKQAAGFLRIRNGDNPLDITAVHPESYVVVEQERPNDGRKDGKGRVGTIRRSFRSIERTQA
jgi:transcriptional accessory protein Tex/SPT6